MFNRLCDYFIRLWQAAQPVKPAVVPVPIKSQTTAKNCHRSINEDAEF